MEQDQNNETVSAAPPEQDEPAVKKMEWADDLAVELRTIGEVVSELVDELDPRDPDAAYQYLGAVIGDRTGRAGSEMTDLLEALAEIHHDYHHTEAMKEEEAA